MTVINQKTGKPFPTGAKLSPRHKLLAAAPHRVFRAPPAQSAIVPPHLDPWGNDTYGDCVTAEEAFAKACYSPEIFIPTQTVVDWAQAGGFRDGADLASVLDAMKSGGFMVGQQLYDDGDKAGVDYTNETVLQSAISAGPVKIAIGSGDLPSGAGNQQGWYALTSNGAANDHCVALCGYGPAEWLYQQLNVPLPPALAGLHGYLLYTWATIGFVSHAWITGTCQEAWVRNPTTVGVPPLPGPTPVPPPVPTPPGPTPPVPPPDPPHPPLSITLAGHVQTFFGPQAVTLAGTAVPVTQQSRGSFQLRRTGGAVPTIPFSLLFADLMAILVAFEVGSMAAVEQAVMKLLADLGL